MKKIIIFIICLGLIYLYFFHAKIVDISRNKTLQKERPLINNEVTNLHRDLFIVDLHCDQLLWNRDLLEKTSYGHFDYPRAREGNMSLQVFSSVTRVPMGINYHENDNNTDMIALLSFLQHWPTKTWLSSFEKAMYMAKKLEKFSQNENVIRILDSSDFDKIKENQLGVIFSIEGAHALEGKMENLYKLYGNGLKMIGLTHFFDNEVGGSAHGLKKGGITDFGKKVVKESEKIGVIIDLAHASEPLMNDVFSFAKRPVVISHGGVKGTCPSPRNISDEILFKLKNNGGIIGIGYWKEAVCGVEAKHIVDAMEYVINKIGIEHVALGSDYDGTVTTLFDVSGLSQITNELVNRGHSVSNIKKIMGENALRVLKEGIMSLSE